jgi:hypothetical protein
MVDGRLLAAYRSMYETAAVLAARQKQQAEEGSGADAGSDSPAAVAELGASWQQHLRLAVARRARELLRSMRTPLLADLQRLAAWEQESGQEQHSWAAAQRYYAAAVGVYEAAQHADLGAANSTSSSSSAAGGLLDAGAAGKDVAWAQMLLQQGQQQQGGDWQEAAGGGLLADSEASTGSGAGAAPLLLDAGAVGADLELAQALLQEGRQQQESSQGSDGLNAQPGSSSSILPVIYRCYKKQILWDAVLLPDA